MYVHMCVESEMLQNAGQRQSDAKWELYDDEFEVDYLFSSE